MPVPSSSVEVASLHATIRIKKDNVDKDLKETKSGLQKFGEALKENKMLLLAAGAAVTATAAIIKKSFEFSKEGAAFKQLTQSFELLMANVGAAPTLLEDMRRASNRTMTDQRLMASTQMLLAGASGRVATEFANAMPTLVEYARAASKLNPELGGTDFLLQSISTGIKRQSRLILDNLGIVVSVTEANTNYAKQVGKTVQQLTMEEKQLAMLNEVMLKGNILMEQAGGSGVSMVDAYEQIEVAADYAGRELKALLDEALRPAVTFLAEGAVEAMNMDQTLQALRKAFDEGRLSGNAYWDVFSKVKDGTEDLDYALYALHKVTRQTHMAQNAFSMDATQDVGVYRAVADAISIEVKQFAALHGEVVNTNDYWKMVEAQNGLQNSAAGAAEENKNLALAITSVSAANFGSEALKALGEAYAENKISADQYDEAAQRVMMGLLGMTAVESNAGLAFAKLKKAYEDGELTAEEYASALADLYAHVEAFDGKNVISTVTIKTLYEGGGPTGQALTAPIDTSPPTIRPSGGDSGSTYATPQKMGGSFVVPPGFYRDNLKVPVSSGEHVTVTPAGAEGSGGQNIYITIQGDATEKNARQLARLVGREVRRKY